MENQNYGRLVIICPMVSHCETVRNIFETHDIPVTYLEKEHAEKLNAIIKFEKKWGIVAGTGTGKSVFLRRLAKYRYGKDFTFDVVNREERSTPQTWEKNILVITTGVAMHWLKSGYFDQNDAFVIDEIHQTSEHLEIAMALIKHLGSKIGWMSATIDPGLYQQYFGTELILECKMSDPEKKAKIEALQFGRYAGYGSRPRIVTHLPWVKYYLEEMGGLKKILNDQLGVAVFVPTRKQAEDFASKYSKFEGLHADFYHGGETARKLRAYLRGEIPKPFVIFMTAAGSSSLNIAGLDAVIIRDETFKQVVVGGVKVMQKVNLESNEILQMAGRVVGRVKDGLVVILSNRDIDYFRLVPRTPKFLLGGDLETMALTLARLEFDLSDLDFIGRIDREQYWKVQKLLQDRELITNEGNLTEFGKKVEKIPVSRVWAEHLAELAEDNDNELLSVMVVVSCISSLHGLLNRNESNIKDFVVKGNDFLTAYTLIEIIINYMTSVVIDPDFGHPEYRLEKFFFKWCKETGIYPKEVQTILSAISAVCRALKIELFEELPKICEENDLEERFNQFLVDISALEYVSRLGITKDGRHVFPSRSSVCGEDVFEGKKVRTAMIARVYAFRPKGKLRIMHSLEGVELELEDLDDEDIETIKPVSVKLSSDGAKIALVYQISAFGFDNFMIVDGDEWHERLPQEYEAEFKERAKAAFVEWLVNHSSEGLNQSEVKINERVIDYIVSLREREYSFVSVFKSDVARQSYEKLLCGRNIYTVSMARKANVSLTLDINMFCNQWSLKNTGYWRKY